VSPSPDPALRVRDAGPGDASRIASIHVRSWKDAYRSFAPAAYLESLEVDPHRVSYWQPLLERSDPGYRAWLATWSGIPAGYANVEPAEQGGDPSREVPAGLGWIDHIHVAPEFRGRGVGAALFRHALAHLASEGFSEAALWVYEENALARAFYDRFGWTTDGAHAAKRIRWVGRDGAPDEADMAMVRYRGTTAL
jgi:GNAT superfamily N-acetyltransferase